MQSDLYAVGNTMGKGEELALGDRLTVSLTIKSLVL